MEGDSQHDQYQEIPLAGVDKYELVKYLSQSFESIQFINDCIQFQKSQLKTLWEAAYDEKHLQGMQAVLKLSRARLTELKKLKLYKKSANQSTNIVLTDFKLRVDRFWIQILSILSKNIRFNQAQFLNLYLQFADFSFILINSVEVYQKHKGHIVQIIYYCKIISNRKTLQLPIEAQLQVLKIKLTELYILYQLWFQADPKKRQEQIQQVKSNLVQLLKEIQKRNNFSFLMKLFIAHLFELDYMFVNGFMPISINNNIKTQLEYYMEIAQQQINFQIRLDIISILVKYFGRFCLQKNISTQFLQNKMHRLLQTLATSFSTKFKKNIQKMQFFLMNNDIFFELKQITIYLLRDYAPKEALLFLKIIKQVQFNARKIIKDRFSPCQVNKYQVVSFEQKNIDKVEQYCLQDIQTSYQNSLNEILSQIKQPYKKQKKIVQNKNLFKNQFILAYYNLFYQPYSMQIFFQKNFLQTKKQIQAQSPNILQQFPLNSNDFIQQHFNQIFKITQKFQMYFEIDIQTPKQEIQIRCKKFVKPTEFHQMIKNRSTFQQIFLLYHLIQCFQNTEDLFKSVKECFLNLLTYDELNKIIQFIIFQPLIKNVNFFKLNTFLYYILVERIQNLVKDIQICYNFNLLKQLSRMLKYYNLLKNGLSQEGTVKLTYCKSCRSVFKNFKGVKHFQLVCLQCRVGFLDRFQFPKTQYADQSPSFIKLMKNSITIKQIISKRLSRLKKRGFQHLGQVFAITLLYRYSKFMNE